MCFLLLQNTTSEFHYKLTALSLSLGVALYLIQTHIHIPYVYTISVHIGEAGPTVCTQESPFRQFHSSSYSLRTNLTMLHICFEAAAVRHVLRKQRRKRKNEKRTHMHFSIPFLRCPFPKIIMYYVYGPHWLCVLYTTDRPTNRSSEQLALAVLEWANQRINEKHMSSGNERTQTHTATDRPNERHV